jgi:hypothetical protein
MKAIDINKTRGRNKKLGRVIAVNELVIPIEMISHKFFCL